MKTCELCKYGLIYIDKKGKETLRCYKDFMDTFESTGEIISPPYKDVTNDVGVCKDYKMDTTVPAAKTYTWSKHHKKEETK